MKQQCESQNSNPKKPPTQSHVMRDGPPGGSTESRDRGANILGAPTSSSSGQKRDADDATDRQDSKRMKTDDERYERNFRWEKILKLISERNPAYHLSKCRDKQTRIH